ncbi:uncharacterized protein [Linepithema humile]|uniref:uncharacterized protein n=1 Tax=Linepithema humile TaxID=83485 RepID=UPI0006239E7B|nr:PREDICTED: uncharacterized protein LOC105667972 [Linepithema humile]XP_012215543.1 PREDICTED: uncharacterized protein LOC105667972 [Linepithema humile]
MENEEINRLRQLKKELLEKVNQLKDSLKRHEENRHQSSSNFTVTLPSDDENQESSTELSSNSKVRQCKTASHITGITFEDVSKDWLHDNIYMYKATVVTRTITFNLELKVDFKNTSNFKIDNIMCYFTDINNCYMLEISPWCQQITNRKNFSVLMSALSGYNENNILRSKILHSLESKRYASIEHNEDDGGMLVHVHSPVDTKKNYVIFHWMLKFLELTWQIEHYFTVNPTNIGIEFSEQNSSLLKDFCEITFTKNSLIKLWDKLCTAVDTYAKSTKGTL